VTFELWRQDDNGQRFLIGRYADLDEAKRRLAELTRSQHKQIYWIAESMNSRDGIQRK
jgi:hypothetical protein